MLVARLAHIPTRAEQRTLSDRLSCRLFADAGYMVGADDIGRTIYGKPQLRDSPLHHSISNTRSLSIGVLGPDPIGIDVEALDRPLRVASELLMRRMFASAAEATACLQHWTLIQAWTAKEAVLKAAGLGLGGLANVRIAPDRAAAVRLALRPQPVDAGGFSVAVAKASVARGRDGASSSRVRSRLQQRLAEPTTERRCSRLCSPGWPGGLGYLIVVPILSAVAFLWLGVTGWLLWQSGANQAANKEFDSTTGRPVWFEFGGIHGGDPR